MPNALAVLQIGLALALEGTQGLLATSSTGNVGWRAIALQTATPEPSARALPPTRAAFALLASVGLIATLRKGPVPRMKSALLSIRRHVALGPAPTRTAFAPLVLPELTAGRIMGIARSMRIARPLETPPPPVWEHLPTCIATVLWVGVDPNATSFGAIATSTLIASASVTRKLSALGTFLGWPAPAALGVVESIARTL